MPNFDELIAHFKTLPLNEQKRMMDSVWDNYLEHEKLAYELATLYTHPEYGQLE